MPGPWDDYAEKPASASAAGPWDDYAKPANARKGPETAANARESPQTPEEHGFGANAVMALPEGIAATASGMLAKPISDVAGLAATGKEMISPTPGGGDPAGFKRHVQESLTYEPRTAAGKAVAEYNPLALIGKGLGWAGDKANEIIAPPSAGPVRSAIGHGVAEGIQQAPGILGAKAGAKAAEGLPGKQAALDVAKGENVMKDTGRDTFQAAGYLTPPEHGIKAAASGLAGKTKTEKILSEKNEANATRKLGGEVGMPEGGALTGEEFERLKDSAGDDYRAMTAAAGPKLAVTPSFTKALNDSLAQIEDKMKFDPETYKGMRPAAALIRSYAKKVDMPTEGALEAVKDLRKQAKSEFVAGKNEIATARLGVANQLENLFEENLAAKGDTTSVDAFRAARERFAKIYLLERVTNDATGRVNLQKLASLSESKAYKGVLTGEFKTAADFAKTFRKAAQRSTGEAAPRLTVFDGMFAIGSMMGGHFGAAATEIGGRLAIPMMAERGMLQNKTPPYQVSASRKALPYALPAAGAGGQLEPPPQ